MPVDTIIKVTYALGGDNVLGLPGLYALAYVMLCRKAWAPDGKWEDLLAGTGPFRLLGGWPVYCRALEGGWLDERLMELRGFVETQLEKRRREGLEVDRLPASYEIARLLVLGGMTREGLAAIAANDVGLHLSGSLLHYAWGDEVWKCGWPPGAVVVRLPVDWQELHLYTERPWRSGRAQACEEDDDAG